jgi:hypothetical protein
MAFRLQRTGSSVSQVFQFRQKKERFFVASSTNFAPRKFLERIITVMHHDEPESKAQSKR